jgi:ribosomal protein L14E/L6E/L27E
VVAISIFQSIDPGFWAYVSDVKSVASFKHRRLLLLKNKITSVNVKKRENKKQIKVSIRLWPDNLLTGKPWFLVDRIKWIDEI